MITNFIAHFRELLAAKRQSTFQALGALAIVFLIVWGLISAILGSGFLGFIIAGAIVPWASTLLPQLAWFWGPLSKEARKAADPLPTPAQAEHIEPQPEVVASNAPPEFRDNTATNCEPVRRTPVGTFVMTHNSREAVLMVKSAIRVWCWASPILWTAAAFLVFLPIGFAIGISSSSWQNAETNAMLGAALGVLLGLAIAIVSYFSNRPWVKVIITPETVTYGGRVFDRRYLHGVSTAYDTKETDIKSGFLDGNFGVTVMSMRYGRWGEDLKYMVNARYAPPITVWMNEIIDSVGAPPPPDYDPYAGRKIELL